MALTKVQIDGVEFSDSTDLNVDNGTLVVDATNNRVGVGTTAPGEKLHISGGTDDRIVVSGSGSSGLLFQNTSGTNLFQIVYDDTATDDCFITTSHDLVFRNQEGTQGGTITERARIDSSGRLGLGTSTPSDTLDIGTGGIFFSNQASGSPFPEQKLKWSNDSTTANGFYISQGTDRNGKIWHEQGLDIQFGTSNTQRMVIDSSGRVGIGTTSPGYKLSVQASAGAASAQFTDATNSTLRVMHPSAGVGLIAVGGSQHLALGTGYAENARIDSSGRLLVGTTTAPSYASTVVLQGTSSGSTDTARLVFSRNSTISNSGLGRIHFGKGSLEGAEIQVVGEGTWTEGSSHPTRISFLTAASGSTTPTERMRIENNGTIWAIGTGGFNYYLAKSGSGNIYNAHYVSTAEGSGFTYNVYYRGNTNVGSIAYNGTGITYNTTSDYRLKENIVPIGNAINRLQQLKPSRFNFIAETGFDCDCTIDGFIAHEVKDVVPEAVTGEKDAVNDDGSIKPQNLDVSRLVPLLTAALQEALAKIETLEQRLNDAGIA